MRAVQVIEGSDRFNVRDIAEPQLREGGAIVRMEAALVASYMAALPSGAWMTPPRPFVPGQCAVGVVEQGSGRLQVGQRVYFDAYTGSNDATIPYADHGFLGCFAITPDVEPALRDWPNGSFAEVIHAPKTCFTPIPAGITAPSHILCRLGWFGTALAGLERAGFQPGMILAINGAAGLVGAGAVALALASGAEEVHIFGRRSGILQDLVALDPSRVRIGNVAKTGALDIVLDCASGEDVTVTAALVARLRRYGVASFVGALTAPLPVDTAALMRNGNALVGSFWFTPDILLRLFGLIESEALDLSRFTATKFDLAEIDQAIDFAQTSAGGLRHTVLSPESPY